MDDGEDWCLDCIEMFPDIDLVLFGGRLLGHVTVHWASSEIIMMAYTTRPPSQCRKQTCGVLLVDCVFYPSNDDVFERA